MTSIEMWVDGCVARAKLTGPLAAGTVGIAVKVHLSPEYLQSPEIHVPSLIVESGGKATEAALRTWTEELAEYVLPWERLIAGQKLRLGLMQIQAYGSGKIPTVWAGGWTVERSTADADPGNAAAPTQQMIDQLTALAGMAEIRSQQALANSETVLHAYEAGELDGYSPRVEAIQKDDGYDLVIETKTGDEYLTVTVPIRDGVSPTINVQMRDEGLAFRIQDADGIKEQVITGLKLPPTKLSQLQNDVGFVALATVQQMIMDADTRIAAANTAAGNAYALAKSKYSKPETGIPAEDLERGAIPERLPNPQTLYFTGAVNGSYNGSTAMTVHIPEGGGGSDVTEETVAGWGFAKTSQIPAPYDDTEIKGDLSGLQDAVNGKYTKPSTGIPASDLASGVIPTIPQSLPNPNALTFTGAATGSYDGSAPLSIEIPSGGGGGAGTWSLIATLQGDGTATEINADVAPFTDGLYAFHLQRTGNSALSGTNNCYFKFGESGIWGWGWRSSAFNAHANPTFIPYMDGLILIKDGWGNLLGCTGYIFPNSPFNSTDRNAEKQKVTHGNKISLYSQNNIAVPAECTLEVYKYG